MYANQHYAVIFASPLNPGIPAPTDGSGGYSVSLFADQNFTATTDVNTPGGCMIFNNLPVGTLDHSQTYNLVMPTARLTVSVRDATGNPITSGKLTWDGSNISPLPNLPGTSAFGELHRQPRHDRNRRNIPALRQHHQPVRLQLDRPRHRLLHPIPEPQRRNKPARLLPVQLTRPRQAAACGANALAPQAAAPDPPGRHR